MTADDPGATQDYSTRIEAILRGVLGLAALAGVVLLVVSTFATVVEIRVLTTSELIAQDTQISGGDLHGIALVLVALFGLVMLVGALRGARPAMVALAATGLLALALVVFLDVPELDNTGQIADFYEDVSAGAAAGFYYETLGAVLLLLAGGAMFVLSAPAVSLRVQTAGRELGAGAGRLGAGLREGAQRAAAGARRAKAGAQERAAERRRAAAARPAEPDEGA